MQNLQLLVPLKAHLARDAESRPSSTFHSIGENVVRRGRRFMIYISDLTLHRGRCTCPWAYYIARSFSTFTRLVPRAHVLGPAALSSARR